MLANPYLQPPQIESPKSRSWGRGFAYGFQGPLASLPTPADVEDEGAFQEGVEVGQQAASDGLDVLSDACVALNPEGGEIAEGTSAGIEVLEGSGLLPKIAKLLGTDPTLVGRLVEHGLTGRIFSGVMFLLDLAIALPTRFDDPETGLMEGANKLRDILSGMGINDPMELFVGGGVDFDARECELKLTPVFRSSEAALAAARALGRSKVLVVGWRTNQSGAMEVVEQEGW
jgi:hypothetical protein